MKNQQICYQTDTPVSTCIERITTEPWEYGDELASMWYRCDSVTDRSILVTFRGGKFRKMMQTRYLVTFSSKQEQTFVTLDFQDEMLRMPPMTPIGDIDRFMEQKIHAVRIKVHN